MVESVTASLAAGLIVVVLVAMAIARAVKRRAQPTPKHGEHEETRARRAS
jgi:membrane protein implicated in regulation of membrane protease activity